MGVRMNSCPEYKGGDLVIIKRFFVAVRMDFEALHCWPTCPFEDVSFLKTIHRHRFFVVLKKEIVGDREVEFIQLQRKVKEFITENYEGKDLGSMSCEKIAEELLDKFEASFVSVLEDNENGSEVLYV